LKSNIDPDFKKLKSLVLCLYFKLPY